MEKLEKILNKLVYWASAAMVLVPLLAVKYSYFPYVYYKGVAIFWLVEICLAAYLILFFIDKKYRPQFKTMEWLMMAFGFIYIITSIFGLCFNRSWWGDWGRFEGTYLILHFIVWAIILISIVKEKADWHKLFKISIGVSLAVAVLGFLQLTGVKIAILPEANRIGSTLGNAAYYSSYALMSLFLAVYLWFLAGAQKIRWYYLAAIVINLVALVLTGTRGALIGLGAAVIYYLFISLKKKLYKDPSQKLFFYTASVTVLLGVCLIVLGQTPYLKNIPYLSRFTDVNLQTATVQTRFEAWKYGLEGFKENWLLGVGPENYNIVYDAKFQPIMYKISGSEVWFQRSHNKLIDQAVMTGIFGLALYLLIYYYLFVYLNRAYKAGKMDFSSVLALRLLLIGYFIQNLFIFDNHSTYILYFLLIAFIVSQLKNQENIKVQEISRLKTVRTIVIALVILAVFSMINIRFLRSNYYAIKALDIRYTQPEFFHEYFQKAVEISVHPIDLANEYASKSMELYVQEVFKVIPKEKMINDFIKLASYQEKSDKQDPDNMFNSYQYFKTAVNLYEVTEDQQWQDKAKYLVDKSINLSPGNIRAYWQKFQLDYDVNKDVIKGREDLDKAIAIAPEVGDNYWLIALMYFSEKNDELGFQFADAAIDHNYDFTTVSDIQLVLAHYYDSQDWGRTEKLMLNYLQLRPKDTDAYFSLAEIYTVDGKIDEAIEILRKILVINPVLTDMVVAQIESLKQDK